MASSLRTALVIAWWLLPFALAMSAWLLRRLGDRQGVKVVAWFGVAVAAGFGLVAATFLMGATFEPHGNASLSAALTSTLGCVFTPDQPHLRYYCPWPSWQFVLLPAIYLVLAFAVVRRSWRHRDPAMGLAALLARLFSRRTFSFVMHRFLWPAIPIAVMGFMLRNSADLDPFKALLVFLGITLLLAAGLIVVALFARWLRVLPRLIGALLLLLLSIYFPVALLMAGFAPHGTEFSLATYTKFQTISLALAYVALVLLGLAISVISKIRDSAESEPETTSH